MPVGPLSFEILHRLKLTTTWPEHNHAAVGTRIRPIRRCSFCWQVWHRGELNKILVVASRAAGTRIRCETRAWGRRNGFGMGASVSVCVCVCVCHIDSVLAYIGASLLQPARGTDQMDDETLIIPSRPIPSKAVINFAELHQI